MQICDEVEGKITLIKEKSVYNINYSYLCQ